MYQFMAEIIATEKVNGAYVEFPYDVKEVFGVGGIIKVKATFDGYVYRGALANMGTGCHIIGITQAIRKAIGKEPGDTVEVTVEEDHASRLMTIPDLLREALEANQQVQSFFETLTDSQKNKYITHIISAKREATKQTRLEKVILMLNNQEKMK